MLLFSLGATRGWHCLDLWSALFYTTYIYMNARHRRDVHTLLSWCLCCEKPVAIVL